ncbi:MAG: N-acetylmuramoyl-L-alanine amidase [Verrucomicrobiales bacterium]
MDEKGNSQLIESWNSLNTFIQDDSKNRTDDSNFSLEIPKAEPVLKPLVILDPGHGGKDGGTVSGDVLEKNLNLLLVKKIANELKRYQISVVTTRSVDEMVGLSDRALIANKYPNAIFVSIHHNAATLNSAKGIETYYSNQKPKSLKIEQMHLLKIKEGEAFVDNRSKMLAKLLHSSVCQVTDAADRGVRDRSLAMTRWVSCPSVLIECGFLTNPEEKLDLLSESYRDALSRGVADGILKYFSEVNNDSYYGVTFKKAPRAIAEL